MIALGDGVEEPTAQCPGLGHQQTLPARLSLSFTPPLSLPVSPARSRVHPAPIEERGAVSLSTCSEARALHRALSAACAAPLLAASPSQVTMHVFWSALPYEND